MKENNFEKQVDDDEGVVDEVDVKESMDNFQSYQEKYFEWWKTRWPFDVII